MNMKRIAAWLLAALLLMTGCAFADAGEAARTAPAWQSISPAQAMRMMEEDESLVIVDVRRAEEYEAGHIPGAILIPLDTIGEEMPEALPDPDQTILLYCRSGRRSREAAQRLSGLGYTRVYDFGGIDGWPGETVTGGPSKPRGHYVFQPKVCSFYMEEVFGKAMCETWFNLVDAVLEGKDTFACPDQHTYDWVMGQFPDKCLPVLRGLIDYAWDREHSVKDGVASFTYLVPPEEVVQRIAEFGESIEDILNENLTDDDTDLEKALALYEYFANTYTYDYATAEYNEGYPDWLCSYRVFSTGTGICQEFSVAYAYLLMQVGIDATTMSGRRTWDGMPHQWSYVRMNGHNYHIDPTYVISDHTLSYFMMDDAHREYEDGYRREYWYITSNYSREHPHPEYVADDASFAPLQGGEFVSIDREHHLLRYRLYDENGRPVTRTFPLDGAQ